jgi:hypothetical protein
MPLTAFACQGYLIGFKGVNNQFDARAFMEYSNNVGLCGRIYSPKEVDEAIKFITNNKLPYELYGYSMGAESVRKILEKRPLRKPEFVITIGAYRTANVDFDKFNVPYVNYFDDSGVGQKSWGYFLKVPHDKIQQEVNKVLFKNKP